MRETKQTSINKAIIKKYLPLISMGVFVVIAVSMILTGYVALQIPLVPVCTIVILEAVLCVCLNKIPVWVHGLVIVIQVALGFFMDRAALMVCMAVVYAAAVALTYFWSKEE